MAADQQTSASDARIVTAINSEAVATAMATAITTYAATIGQ
jgi:hypothetical protein